MRSLAFVVPILVLAALPASAAVPLPAASVVAALHAPSAAALHATGGADLPVAPVYASLGGVHSESACTATAQCGTSSSVSCSGLSTCTAVDQNCSAGQTGYAECDGTKHYCSSSCCPCGTCGATRWHETQSCCAANLHLWYAQQCTSSGWQNTGPTDCLVQCNGGGGL